MKAMCALARIIGLGILLPAFSFHSQAQSVTSAVQEETVLYRSVPDILIDTGEVSIHLSDLWTVKPVLLTFVFTQCVGVCTPYLEILDNALYKTGGFGTDYQVVILSFDSTDNMEKMRLLRKMAALSENHQYVLATTDSAALRQISSATGFWYQKIGTTNQFDHPMVVVGIGNGVIRRVLTGGEISPARLNEVIEEMKGYYIRSYPLPSSDVRFRCFQVDAVTGESKPDWGLLILAVPCLFAVISIFVIFYTGKTNSPSCS